MNRPRTRTPGPVERPGFTLIELLVVISIIALLIGILLPALAASRRVARDMLCGSNIRQIAVGVFTYSQDFGEVTPAPELRPNFLELIPWQAAIWENVTNTDLDDTQLRINSKHDYLRETVFECPQSLAQQVGYSETDHRHNGYGINNGVIGVRGNVGLQKSTDERKREAKRMDLIDSPASTLLLADSTRPAIEYYDRGSSENSIALGDQAMLGAKGRHGEQLDRVKWNIAFYDGSARLMLFNDIPATPLAYYNASRRVTPWDLLGADDVERTTKVFWTGQGSR